MTAIAAFLPLAAQGSTAARGRSATVDFRVACCQKLLVTNDRSDACVLRLAA